MMSNSLTTALDRLARVATSAGIDPAQARTEGAQLAAAVAEPAQGAFIDWANELGRPAAAQEFFAAASHARRWRVSPTPLMSQLANTSPSHARDYADALGEVCTAACLLGTPDPRVAGTAATAAAAQLQAVRGISPSTPPVGAGEGPRGGLDPTLLARLRASEDQRRAMDQFEQAGPAIFNDVLEQMRVNQSRIEELRNSPLFNPAGGPPPSQPGQPGQPGQAGQPAVPGQLGAAGEPAPTQTAADPNKPAAEPEKPQEPERSVKELLAELDGLVGLEEVKAEIHRQTAVLRVEALRKKAGLKVPAMTRHMVFVGNPGTGKTTVARLVAGIYKALGLLSKGQLVEVDRSELVAGYLGQTALKTAEVCKSAIGGVLFIDEAYALSGDQYGEEAITTLVKEMEDNRDDLVVIVAGYPRPMSKFITENPGLHSRFRTTIIFDDYTDDELCAILQLQVDNADYTLGDDAMDAFRSLLSLQIRDETFGNGRFARNTLEGAIGRQAWRLRDIEEPSVEELRTLAVGDILGDVAIDPVEWPEDPTHVAREDPVAWPENPTGVSRDVGGVADIASVVNGAPVIGDVIADDDERVDTNPDEAVGETTS